MLTLDRLEGNMTPVADTKSRKPQVRFQQFLSLSSDFPLDAEAQESPRSLTEREP